MKVLIVDDDPVISETVAICFELRWPKAEIISTDNGEEGVRLAVSQSPQIVILDVGLPGMDGYQALRELRQFTEVPIIMLTARESELAKVKGLEYGADDYMTKPFSHIELLARVRAVLRRAAAASREQTEGVYRSEEAGLEIDLDSRRVIRFGQPINLAPLEYSLLKLLTHNEGRGLTRSRRTTPLTTPRLDCSAGSLRPSSPPLPNSGFAQVQRDTEAAVLDTSRSPRGSGNIRLAWMAKSTQKAPQRRRTSSLPLPLGNRYADFLTASNRAVLRPPAAVCRSSSGGAGHCHW